MSLFGELDIASAQDNPFFKPDGTYVCELTGAEVKTSKKGNKGFALEYTITQEFKKGKKIQEWKPVPMPWELKGFKEQSQDGSPDEKVKENAERNMAFLKARLKDFGIPVEEMNQVDREYLLNKVPELEVTIKNQDGNERITGVKISDEAMDNYSDPFSS
jgi:hypothetical protein